MAWQDVPAFYATLSNLTVTHLALRLLILTGLRSGPVRKCDVNQIDGDVWTIPGMIMKGRKGKTPDFRVPLSTEAIRIIQDVRPHEKNGFLFPSRSGTPISDMTMSRLMERRGLAERPHGFRSSLQDWLAEKANASTEVAETILAHPTGNQVTRAYLRSDFLEQRREFMERWAHYISGQDDSK